MGYQVLARKWRPKNFHQLVGQDHVSQALINALDTDRLHHAYLFTGTRGVGKTTLARILAKCLNCEQGVTSQPCGVCSACQEIDAGRFVDLIEVDAASRTKVEDTRELLDNVQYSPTRGRFKVYLIDEVHMLSSHSFNALLKTLEEPPEHVKFLLATTDPQKLPVTVLSRCLQFQLKNMPPERIVEHLKYLLGEEGVSFEEPALWLLGRAADGSMRDALSLTDQSIAFGQGRLETTQVAQLLGMLDHRHLLELLQALIRHDAAQLMQVVAVLAEQAPDFAAVLQDLSSLLHRLTLAQTVPEALPADTPNRDTLIELAAQVSGEEIQLFYQLAIEGRRDLALAPDPRTGLEMTLLRMLAFRPLGIPDLPEQPLNPQQPKKPQASEPEEAETAQGQDSIEPLAEPPPWEVTPPVVQPAASETTSGPEPVSEPEIQPPSAIEPEIGPEPESEPVLSAAAPAVEPQAPQSASADNTARRLRDNEDWLQCFPSLVFSGWQSSQLRKACLVSAQDQALVYALPPKALPFINPELKQALSDELARVFSTHFSLTFEAADPLPFESVDTRRDRLKAAQKAAFIEALSEEPGAQILQARFGVQMDESSIVPSEALLENTQQQFIP